MLEGLTKNIFVKFVALDKQIKTVGKQAAGGKGGGGMSDTEQKDLKDFMATTKQHMEKAENEFERINDV